MVLFRLFPWTRQNICWARGEGQLPAHVVGVRPHAALDTNVLEGLAAASSVFHANVSFLIIPPQQPTLCLPPILPFARNISMGRPLPVS